MFSKIIHWIGKKRKRTTAILVMGATLCAFSGCGNSETSSTTPDNSSDIRQSASVDKSDISIEQNTSLVKPEIVMDGQLITLPCKVEDIEGITIDREYSFVVVPATENVDEYSTAYFYYDGKRVGLIRLDGDCSEKANLDKETVVGIDFYDNIPVSYLGLTFQSKSKDIIDTLGNPDKDDNTIMSYYINGDPADHIDFDFNSNGKMKAVRIYLGLI